MQTSVSTAPSTARAGRLADVSPVQEVISRMVSTRQLAQITVIAANAEVYTVIINGVSYSYTSDGSATTAEITAGLLALLVAAIPAALVSAVQGSTAAKILIEGLSYDTDVTITSTGTTPANCVTLVLVPFGEALPFGVFVTHDERVATTDASCRLPRQSADVTGGVGLGVVKEDLTLQGTRGATAGSVPSQTAASVLRRGRIWVRVEEAVAVGDPAFVRFATGVADPTQTQLGTFRKSADTATAVALPGATFRTGAAAGALAIVELAP